MNIRDIDCNESLEEMKNHFQRIIEKRHDRFVSTHMTKSGATIEVEVSVTFLNIKQGRFYVFIKNITQEQQLKRNMLDQNEKLYEIAFLQSHQVRAPIVRLLGLINLINYDDFSDPENKEIIHALKDSTVNFDEIIREIINKTNDLHQLKQENDAKQ
jgi:light-regulated signal transduction histidine kinase (bacteriophytochrome)